MNLKDLWRLFKDLYKHNKILVIGYAIAIIIAIWMCIPWSSGELSETVDVSSGTMLGSTHKTFVLGSVMAWYEKPTPRVIIHKWWAEDSLVNLYINIAYQVSNWDMEFIAMLEWENGQWNPYRQSEVWSYWDYSLKKNLICNSNNWNSTCKQEQSRWFCQLHARRHSDITNDPRFWENPTWQLSKCYQKRVGWTKFYGYNPALKSRFEKI